MSRFHETLDQRTKNRGLLRLLLDDLWGLLLEPADAKNVPWIIAVVDKVLTNFHQQVEFEAHGEFFADVLNQYPGWQSQVEVLHREHQSLLAELAAIRAMISKEAEAGTLSSESYRKLMTWRTAFLDHDQREVELIRKAFQS